MDYVYHVMENTEEFHTRCVNCDMISRRIFSDGGFYCSGMVLHPTKEFPFDVIRKCILNKGTDENISITDYTPDEALALAKQLTQTTMEWLMNNKKYLKFRGVNSNSEELE